MVTAGCNSRFLRQAQDRLFDCARARPFGKLRAGFAKDASRKNQARAPLRMTIFEGLAERGAEAPLYQVINGSQSGSLPIAAA